MFKMERFAKFANSFYLLSVVVNLFVFAFYIFMRNLARIFIKVRY